MANAIYKITFASSRQAHTNVDGGLVFAASTTDARDVMKGLHPEIPAADVDAATVSAITANGGMATDATGLSMWAVISGSHFYADATAGDTLEDLQTALCLAINLKYTGMASVTTPGVTSTAGVITIASGANLGKAVITAGVGYRNGGAIVNGGTYKSITGLAPTVSSAGGSDAAARTITSVAPSSQAIPAGFGYKVVSLRSPVYNDTASDVASSGEVAQYGYDPSVMPTLV